jgi:hypothetical protein
MEMECFPFYKGMQNLNASLMSNKRRTGDKCLQDKRELLKTKWSFSAEMHHVVEKSKQENFD